MASAWWDKNSQQVTLTGLKDASGAFINDATVTVTVTDLGGNEVGGVTWPVAMAEDGTSEGTYVGTVPAAAELTPGQYIYVVVTAVSGDSTGEWSLKVPVKRREGC